MKDNWLGKIVQDAIENSEVNVLSETVQILALVGLFTDDEKIRERIAKVFPKLERRLALAKRIEADFHREMEKPYEGPDYNAM